MQGIQARRIIDRNFKHHFAVLAILVAILSAVFYRPVQGAPGGIVWGGEPLNLSNSFTSSTFPFVLADTYGQLHVVWAEDLNGAAVNPQNPIERSNAIVYSRWDGKTWTEPVDLFFTQNAGGYNFPYLALDAHDRLHMVWQAFDGIYYSSAYLQDAGSVKAWSTPQLLAAFRGDGPRLLAVPNGDLVMVFAAWEQSLSGSSERNIYFTRSTDSGLTWNQPQRLSDFPDSLDIQLSHPVILATPDDMLHIVWQLSEPPDYTGSAVFYSRSSDAGATWLPSIELARRSENENWASAPELARLPNGELHLTWVCGDTAHRCHRLSVDEGQTWSEPSREFGDKVSLAGYDTLFVDGDGSLFWILQLRYPSAIYSSQWLGTRWSELEVVNDGALHEGHYVRAIAALGNQVHLVMVDQTQKEIWYLHGSTGAKTSLPMELPGMPESTEIPLTPTPAMGTQLLLPHPTPSNQEFKPIQPGSQGQFLFASILPVLLIFAAVIGLRKLLDRPS